MALSEQEEELARQASFGGDIAKQREAAIGIADIEYGDEEEEEASFSSDFSSIKSATNKETGEKLFNVDGQWITPEQTASDSAGNKAYLLNGSWHTPKSATEDGPIDEDTLVSDDIKAGLAQGFSESFTGSMGTNMEASDWMPDFGRLFSENPETGETEFYQSTPEWLGMSEEKWDSMETKDRRLAISKRTNDYIDKTWKADKASAAYNISKFTGMIADPSTLLPVMGATKLGMATTGAAMGSADMAAWSAAQEGAVDPVKTAVGAALGFGTVGILANVPTAVKGVSRVASRAVRSKEANIARDSIADFDRILAKNVSTYSDHSAAYAKTMSELGIEDSTVTKWLQDAGVQSKLVAPANDARKVSTLDKIIEPISERFKRLDPEMARHLQDGTRSAMAKSHELMSQVDEFVVAVDSTLQKSAPAAHRALKKAMLNNDDEVATQLIANHMGSSALKNYKMYKESMDEMYGLMSQARGGKIGNKVSGVYLHRAVKDHEAIKRYMLDNLGKEEVSRVQKIIIKEGAETTDEINAVYSRYLSGVYDSPKVMQTPSAAKARKLREIPDELLDAFHDPAKATHSYIRSGVDDAFKKSFFGADIADKYGDNLTDSISEYTTKAMKRGRIKDTDLDELKLLLDLRFRQGLRQPNQNVQAFKNLSYSALLGNPLSAATQVGDVFLGMYKNGVGNALHGLKQSMTGKGLDPKDWGMMDNMMEELVSTGKTQKLLSKALKYGGFQAVDKLGKKTLMNGSLRKYQRMAAKNPRKLEKQLGEAYGKDFPQLSKDLKAGKITDDVKTAVWMDLADIQPISLLEMPQKYLENPNGRLFYMLKTFTMKYANLLRRDVLKNFKQGNNKTAIANGIALTSLFTAGGATSDVLKNVLLGRQPDMEEILVDNAIANSLLFNSRYSGEKAAQSSRPVTELVNSLAPPMAIFDPVVSATIKAVQGDYDKIDGRSTVRTIPLIGRILDNYAMGGLEEYNKEH